MQWRGKMTPEFERIFEELSVCDNPLREYELLIALITEIKRLESEISDVYKLLVEYWDDINGGEIKDKKLADAVLIVLKKQAAYYEDMVDESEPNHE